MRRGSIMLRRNTAPISTTSAGWSTTGASLHLARINTKGTLLDPTRDDRSDWYYGVYSQADYPLTRTIRLIGAARWDQGDLFDSEITPRIGILFRPSKNHFLRFTVNRAFLTPSHAELFLHLHVATQDLSAVEGRLRASSLGPSLSEVPQGELFTNSAGVRVLAINNPNLVPQKVTSIESRVRLQGSNITTCIWND